MSISAVSTSSSPSVQQAVRGEAAEVKGKPDHDGDADDKASGPKPGATKAPAGSTTATYA